MLSDGGGCESTNSSFTMVRNYRSDNAGEEKEFTLAGEEAGLPIVIPLCSCAFCGCILAVSVAWCAHGMRPAAESSDRDGSLAFFQARQEQHKELYSSIRKMSACRTRLNPK